jgi:DNA polymerase-3 subunit gamma/tau
MVLVRLCHAADLPTPDEALRMIGGNGGAPIAPGPQMLPQRAQPGPAAATAGQAVRAQAAPRPRAPEPQPEPGPRLNRFEDVIAHARAERDVVLANALERTVRPVRFEPGQIEIALTEAAEPDLPQRLGQALQAWTGRRWIVAVSREAAAAETAHEARQRSRATMLDEVRADPLVRQLLERFPGAEIVGVRERSAVEEEAPAPEAIPDVMPDPEPNED